MEIKIIEDRPNPLLKRHEYRFEIAHATAATPSRDSVRGELSKLVRAPKDRVIIERMAARYGTATTRGDALVYETADAAKSITRDHILVRNGLKEKTVKGATPAAEVPTAQPPPALTETPKAEPAKHDSPKEEAPKAEPKGDHKPEHKPEHSTEPKADSHKGEHKAEHKSEHKAEHSGESKAETHKVEHKTESSAEPKAESHKGEHKPKTPKSESDAESPKGE